MKSTENETVFTPYSTSKKLTDALRYAQKGMKVAVMDGPLYIRGSGGRNDLSDDSNTITEFFREASDPNPVIATGHENQLLALSITSNDVVDGISNIAALADQFGIDPETYILKCTYSKSNKGEYVIIFRHNGKRVKTRIAIQPGVSILADDGHFHLAGNSYKLGWNNTVWAKDYEDGLDPILSPTECPDSILQLAEMPSPYDAVVNRELNQAEAIDIFRAGFKGNPAMKDCHDALCALRATGMAKKDIDPYMATAISNSDSSINKKWLNQCAWFVCLQYEPAYLPDDSTSVEPSSLRERFTF